MYIGDKNISPISTKIARNGIGPDKTDEGEDNSDALPVINPVVEPYPGNKDNKYRCNGIDQNRVDGGGSAQCVIYECIEIGYGKYGKDCQDS